MSSSFSASILTTRGYCKRHGLDGFGEKLALHVLDDILLILK